MQKLFKIFASHKYTVLLFICAQVVNGYRARLDGTDSGNQLKAIIAILSRFSTNNFRNIITTNATVTTNETQDNMSLMLIFQLPLMPRGKLPMFDVVCSRKASGPWETPGIISAAVIGWEGPGCGIPTAAGCIVAALAVVAAAAVGDSPITPCTLR